MTRRIATLTTDFGEDHYVAQMKAVLLAQCPETTIVDISHSISPQNILEGAYILSSTVKWFARIGDPSALGSNSTLDPTSTRDLPHTTGRSMSIDAPDKYMDAVHLCVVDPTVGSKRKPICIETSRGILIGPDNGVLFPAAMILGVRGIFEITHPDIFEKELSHVFHGRDVFAPAGGMLLSGLKPRQLGPPLKEIVEMELHDDEVTVTGNTLTIACRPLHIDSFGNIITSIKAALFDVIVEKYEPSSISIGKDGTFIPLRRGRSYCEGEPGELLLIDSSSGEIEISRRNGNAAGSLGIAMGNDIDLKMELK